MRAIKRSYSTVKSNIKDLFQGSLKERESLANAISSKGVQTNINDPLSTMIENVYNIPSCSFNTFNVTFTAVRQTKSVDVKSIIPNYADLTIDDFAIQIISGAESRITSGWDYEYHIGEWPKPSSYNPSTGILQVYSGAVGYYWSGGTQGLWYATSVKIFACKK